MNQNTHSIFYNYILSAKVQDFIDNISVSSLSPPAAGDGWLLPPVLSLVSSPQLGLGLATPRLHQQVSQSPGLEYSPDKIFVKNPLR